MEQKLMERNKSRCSISSVQNHCRISVFSFFGTWNRSCGNTIPLRGTAIAAATSALKTNVGRKNGRQTRRIHGQKRRVPKRMEEARFCISFRSCNARSSCAEKAANEAANPAKYGIRPNQPTFPFFPLRFTISS